jgi:hypothetical protein
MSDGSFGCFLAVVAMLAGTMIGGCTGTESTEKKWKTEAVKRGHAAWVVAPDGSTTFQWK